MTTTAMQCAAIAGLAGTLALTTAAFAPVRMETVATPRVAQYCAPQQEEPWDTQAHRVYCRNERG